MSGVLRPTAPAFIILSFLFLRFHFISLLSIVVQDEQEDAPNGPRIPLQLIAGPQPPGLSRRRRASVSLSSSTGPPGGVVGGGFAHEQYQALLVG